MRSSIAAMPVWKGGVAERLEATIMRAVPNVKKAVKWNSPFHRTEEDHGFLSIHVFTQYVRMGFFKGALLRPMPPGPSKAKEVRHLHIRGATSWTRS